MVADGVDGKQVREIDISTYRTELGIATQANELSDRVLSCSWTTAKSVGHWSSPTLPTDPGVELLRLAIHLLVSWTLRTGRITHPRADLPTPAGWHLTTQLV